MNKVLKYLAGVLLGTLLLSMTVLAAGTLSVVGLYTGEDNIVIYVKGIEGDVTQTSAQIGTTAAEGVFVRKIDAQTIPMKTLIMVDNSLSINNANREKIKSLVQDLIADRMNGEQVAIATFSETMTVLTEYTDDYTVLKTAVESIEYKDQETYLTDVLCEYLSAEQVQEDVYRRIIVISDGVDNKSIGYTKEELSTMLKEQMIPVYSIGCINGKNNEQLENMFAISRSTSADSFVLDEVENTLDITTVLNADRGIVRFMIKPAAEMMDGSKKAVKLSFQDGGVQQSISMDITMPQKEMVEEEAPASEATAAPIIVATPQPQEEIQDNAGAKTAILVIIASCFVLVGGVIAIVILLLSKRKKKPSFQSLDDKLTGALSNPHEHLQGRGEIVHVQPEYRPGINSEGQTEFVRDTGNAGEEGKTQMIWGAGNTYHVVLTDVDSPMKSFQVPLNKSIVIGRKQEYCNIVLDYDKSVSGRHCQIEVCDGRFYLQDLQSANGTYVNGDKVLIETEIFSGNILKLGRLQVRFDVR